MEMLQTHCYATGTVTLLWKCYKLVVMQQALLRYYRNATGCIDHVTKENLICYIILKLGHYCLLPNPFQFIIYLSLYYFTLYSLS
jgi:hypothetical protein